MPQAKKDEAEPQVEAPAPVEELPRCPVCERIRAADESGMCQRCGYRED